MSANVLHTACRRSRSSLLRSKAGHTCQAIKGTSQAMIYQCRHASDQKPFKSGYDYAQRRRLLDELGVASDQNEALPEELRPILKKRAPRYITEFQSNPHSRQIRQSAQKEDTDMKPFERFKQKLLVPTYEAMTVKPFRHTHATPVQASVLDLLPDLAKPYVEGEDMADRKDILALSSRGTGKSLAFLVPAIDARQRALTLHAKTEVLKEGVISNTSLETQAKRVYAKTRVGALVLTPTREEATTIANEAILLSRNHPSTEVRLFVGGLSKKIQLRDWMKDRRDIVVATPGRLRDLLTAEAIVREGFQYTSLLVLDQADQLLEDGFRDDIDAIIEFLPKSPERQTFIFTDHMSHAVEQLASRVLRPDYISINVATDLKSRYADTPQYHTVLPNASHQIPYLMKLIAHDQMSRPGYSKVILYLPTTRMCQLFTTLVQELRETCFPAGSDTNVYSIHSLLSMPDRIKSLTSFTEDKSGCSVLVTTDLSSRQVEFPAVTRVIQVGIPSSDPVYFQRLGHAARAHGPNARGDLVLLPWEIGYLTWKLMEVPFKPLTVTELDTEIQQLAQSIENQDPEATETTTKRAPPAWLKSSLTSTVTGIEESVKKVIPRLDEDSIRETFVSMLGYYIPKSGEIRAQRPIIVQGAKDWTTDACGLPRSPYVSDTFLIRLGITDGRTKRFGTEPDQASRYHPSATDPQMSMRRGRISTRQSKGELSWKDAESLQLDERDPRTAPEKYRTNLYGKSNPTLLDDDNISRSRSRRDLGASQTAPGGWGRRD